MSEEKWVIQKWRTGDRFEGLTIPEALSMLFSLAEEGGYKVFIGSPGLHPDSTILPADNIDPESLGGHFRLMLDAPAPEPEHDKTPSWHPDCFYAGGCGCNNIRLGVKPTPEPDEWEAWREKHERVILWDGWHDSNSRKQNLGRHRIHAGEGEGGVRWT